MHPFVWLNGAIVPAAEAAVPAHDAGFLLGRGLFETMRVYGGRVLDLDRHLARLARSAAVFGLAVPAAEDLRKAFRALLERNACREARARLTVTPDTALATTGPLPDHATREDPVTLAVASVRVDAASPLAGHKTTSYLPNLVAQDEAHSCGADEALLLNHAGHVAECATANVFAVRDGRVATPLLTDGCLPGIVRGVLAELSAALGVPFEEQHLTLDDLRRADEVFITSSLREVKAVAEIDGTRLPAAPGPVSARLCAAYRQRAAVETGGIP